MTAPKNTKTAPKTAPKASPKKVAQKAAEKPARNAPKKAAEKTTQQEIPIEILHLDEVGYGPQGKHTRRAWRAECLENLLAGKAQFEAWQHSWQGQINEDLPSISFFVYKTLKDGSRKILDGDSLPYRLDFTGQYFDADLYARGFNFLQSVSFVGAIFTGGADFNWARFTRDARFSYTNFMGIAYFHQANFTEYADFINANFTTEASLIYPSFPSVAVFSKASFTGLADFSNSSFTGFAIFNDASFTLIATFSSAMFLADASFRRVSFNQQCRFDRVFDEEMQQWYKAAEFNAAANFENAIFKNVGHFEQVKFNKQIPSFLGVDTASTRLEFSDDSHFAWHDVTEDAVKRLGHLKRLADEHGQIDQALNFNALELHAKAAQATASFSTKLVTGAYEWLSDYGRSFTLPIFWFGFLIWLSFLFALGNYSQQSSQTSNEQCVNLAKNITISNQRAAFEYAMFRASGVLDITDADKQNNAVNCQLFNQPIEPWCMRAWGIFKAIASLGLLFLAALGLRNNYRIK